MPVYGNMGHLQNELHSPAGGAHRFSLTMETDIHRRLYDSGKHLHTDLPTTRDTRKDGLELLTFGPGSKAHMGRAITASCSSTMPYLGGKVRFRYYSGQPASPHRMLYGGAFNNKLKNHLLLMLFSSSPHHQGNHPRADLEILAWTDRGPRPRVSHMHQQHPNKNCLCADSLLTIVTSLFCHTIRDS